MERHRPLIDANYISIDIESSGPVAPEYSMLSLGAIPVGNPSKTFYVEFKPITDKFIPEALAVSGLDHEKLKVAGIEPKKAMNDFNEWLKETSYKKPVFVGFNAPFDWGFVNYYFHKFLGANPFGINAIDIKAYYMGKFNTAWTETSKNKLDIRFKSEHPHTHNALDDAIEQADTFLKIKSYPGNTL